MEDWETAQIEYELQRKQLNERPETVSRATGKKSGCGKMLLLLILSLFLFAAIIISLDKLF